MTENMHIPFDHEFDRIALSQSRLPHLAPTGRLVFPPNVAASAKILREVLIEIPKKSIHEAWRDGIKKGGMRNAPTGELSI